MSLINKALKKAQQQRSPQASAPAPDGTPQTAPAYQNNGGRQGLSLGIIVGLAVGVIVIGASLGALVFLLMASQATPTATQAQSTVEPTAEEATTPITHRTAQPPSSPAPASPPPSTSSPTAPAPSASTAPSVTTASPSAEDLIRELQQQNAQLEESLRRTTESATPTPTTMAETAPGIERALSDDTPIEVDTAHLRTRTPEASSGTGPDPEIIAWLAESTINGVRLGESNRVMLNNRAYQVGEMVNYELGLSVRVVQETRVLFEDVSGNRYMKRF